jgi:glutathione S-transferase
MQLYYVPGACSLAPHIAIREAGLDVKLNKIAFGAERRTEDGRDFYSVSPQGAVPVLELDNGETLTENAVLLQYIAAQAPASGLMPAADGMAHWRMLELLNFVATELHKGIGFLFKNPPQDVWDAQVKLILSRFKLLDAKLGDKPYLAGDNFSVADAYAFVMFTWARKFSIDLSGFPRLTAYFQRMLARPAIQQTLTEEGLPTS